MNSKIVFTGYEILKLYLSQIYNMASMSFKAIRENKILAKISEMVPLLSSKKYLSMVIPELLYGVLDPPSPSKP